MDQNNAADAAATKSDDKAGDQRNIDFEALKSERDAAKKKLREFEEKEAKAESERKKTEEDKLRKDGETKTLLDRRERELAELQDKTKGLEEKAKKADEAEQSLRELSLAKITDPDLKKIAGELSTTSLLAFTERVTMGKILPFGDKSQLGHTDRTLETQLEEALKTGPTEKVVALRRLIAERDKTA